MQGDWLKACLDSIPNIIWTKPCHKLGFCPFGQLVEEFPITNNPSNISCKVFGHNCPVFYCGESISEEIEEKEDCN